MEDETVDCSRLSFRSFASYLLIMCKRFHGQARISYKLDSISHGVVLL